MAAMALRLAKSIFFFNQGGFGAGIPHDTRNAKGWATKPAVEFPGFLVNPVVNERLAGAGGTHRDSKTYEYSPYQTQKTPEAALEFTDISRRDFFEPLIDIDDF
jgi:hypothetical protein